jgi:hypothetical protein
LLGDHDGARSRALRQRRNTGDIAAITQVFMEREADQLIHSMEGGVFRHEKRFLRWNSRIKMSARSSRALRLLVVIDSLMVKRGVGGVKQRQKRKFRIEIARG